MKKFDLNITINLTVLKSIGVITALVGLYGFIYGIYSDKYVMEAITVLGMGLGTLGYRKSLVTKSEITKETLSNGNINNNNKNK